MHIRNDRNFQKTSVNSIADRIRNRIEFIIRRVDGDKTFYDPRLFKWTVDVEHAYENIYYELEKVLNENLSASWESISNDPNVKVGDRWKTFIFCAYGNYIPGNCKICPETYKAIKKIKGIKTAWFSILEPHTKLPLHEGPYNGVLRYHLGLVIPTINVELCGIKVGEDKRTWQNGKSLIFDDSHKHTAWNLTDQRRVVLFVDFVRPLPCPISWINHLAIYVGSKTHFIKSIVEKSNHNG